MEVFSVKVISAANIEQESVEVEGMAEASAQVSAFLHDLRVGDSIEITLEDA
jgi:hypothetical protein